MGDKISVSSSGQVMSDLQCYGFLSMAREVLEEQSKLMWVLGVGKLDEHQLKSRPA